MQFIYGNKGQEIMHLLRHITQDLVGDVWDLLQRSTS